MKYFIIFLWGVLSLAFANEPNDLLGFWKTFDLQHHPRTIIKFYKIEDEFRAEIIGMIDNKDKPKVGMTIIRGLKFANNQWTKGEVLDTDSGHTYQCMIRLSDNGKQMFFRAYIKTPLLGRTLNWERV